MKQQILRIILAVHQQDNRHGNIEICGIPETVSDQYTLSTLLLIY